MYSEKCSLGNRETLILMTNLLKTASGYDKDAEDSEIQTHNISPSSQMREIEGNQ